MVWEMRVRDLEEEGWTTAFTDGSGLNDKAVGGFCSIPNRTDKERQLSYQGVGTWVQSLPTSMGNYPGPGNTHTHQHKPAGHTHQLQTCHPGAGKSRLGNGGTSLSNRGQNTTHPRHLGKQQARDLHSMGQRTQGYKGQ